MSDSSNEALSETTAKGNEDLHLEAAASGTSAAVATPRPGQGGHSTADDVVETPIKGGG